MQAQALSIYISKKGATVLVLCWDDGKLSRARAGNSLPFTFHPPPLPLPSHPLLLLQNAEIGLAAAVTQSTAENGLDTLKFQDIRVLEHLCVRITHQNGKTYFVDTRDVMEECLRDAL